MFKYEHRQAHEEAKEILNEAIRILDNDFSDLENPDTINESKQIIDVMQSNLQNWDEVMAEDEEDEEEES